MLAVVSVLVQGLGAHEVPNDVTVQAYLKPSGGRLLLLARVPLVAMRDVIWPMRAPDLLDVGRATPRLHDAATLWIGDEATVYEGSRALPAPTVVAIRATPSTDRSFDTFDLALGLVTGPPAPDSDQVTIGEGFLDVVFEYPIASEASRFAIDPRWGRLGVRTLTRIRLILPSGAVRALDLEGDPGLVQLDPRWDQASWAFVAAGVRHLLGQTSVLLFLATAILPFRRLRDQVVVAAAFTAAHSLTLFASAFNVIPEALWFPPLVDTLTAFSLVFVGVDNVLGGSIDRRWRGALTFGLVYGFGLALALGPTLQLAGEHALAARLSFNLGVELGQALALALAVPLIALLFRFAIPERLGTVLLSALVVHLGWHALVTRADLLRQYQFVWPDLTPALAAFAVRWTMTAVAAWGLLWLVKTIAVAGRPDPEQLRR